MTRRILSALAELAHFGLFMAVLVAALTFIGIAGGSV
jgi:uncharacterized membrane protein